MTSGRATRLVVLTPAEYEHLGERWRELGVDVIVSEPIPCLRPEEIQHLTTFPVRPR